MDIPPIPDCCELCARQVDELTKHHLIPRTRHGNRKTRRTYRRDEMLTRILWVCRSCHNQIHAVCTEKELETRFHTKELLLNHPEIAQFVAWIRNKPGDFTARTNRMKR